MGALRSASTVDRCLPSRCKTKQMPTITIAPDTVTVRLSTAEKAGALHGDLSIPRSAIVAATVMEDPMSGISGIRAPGYAMPGHAKLGTWRHHDGKDSLRCTPIVRRLSCGWPDSNTSGSSFRWTIPTRSWHSSADHHAGACAGRRITRLIPWRPYMTGDWTGSRPS